MAYPTTLDSFATINPGDKQNVVSHSERHTAEGDAIDALEYRLGIEASAGNLLGYEYVGDAAGKGIWLPSHLAAYDNPILNGAFRHWPQGASFASISNGTYCADNWRYGVVGAAVHDVSQSTDVPSVSAPHGTAKYSLLMDCTTADASIAAGDVVLMRTFIEGQNWLPYAERAFTISFWVKAAKTGTHCLYVQNSGQDRSYVAEYTVNVADTWEWKSVQITASPSMSTGTWDTTTGIGLIVGFTLMSGSTFQTTAGAWQTGNYFATANQVNEVDSTANNFRIYGVRMNLGTTPKMFVPRPAAIEEVLLRRYFQQLGGVTNATLGVGFANSASQAFIFVPFQPMRIAPTPTLAAAAKYTIASPAGDAAGSSVSSSGVTPTGMILVVGTAAVMTTGQGAYCYCTDTAGLIGLSARF